MGRDRFQARQTESPRPAPSSDAGAGQPMPTNHTEPVGLPVIPAKAGISRCAIGRTALESCHPPAVIPQK